jgi:hypothetical protein
MRDLTDRDRRQQLGNRITGTSDHAGQRLPGSARQLGLPVVVAQAVEVVGHARQPLPGVDATDHCQSRSDIWWQWVPRASCYLGFEHGFESTGQWLIHRGPEAVVGHTDQGAQLGRTVELLKALTCFTDHFTDRVARTLGENAQCDCHTVCVQVCGHPAVYVEFEHRAPCSDLDARADGCSGAVVERGPDV